MFFVLKLSFLTLLGFASSQNCTLRDPKDSRKAAFLNDIAVLHNEKFVCTANGFTYMITFCKAASTKASLGNANVIRSRIPERDNDTSVLGRFNSTDIIGQDDWRIVTFGDGDVIVENGSCNGTRWKAMIILSCDLDNSAVELLDPLNAACTSIFLLKTSYICRAPSTNVLTIFLLILLVAFLCYFIIGMAYKRFVTGAKGLEQIPNYDFWRDPTSWKNFINKNDRSDDGWRQSAADSADEPLLHP